MKPKRYHFRYSAFASIVLAFSSIPSAYAASDAWDGSTDTTWATETNWLLDPLAAPGSGETATFNGAGNGNTNIDLGSGVTIGSILFDTSSAAAYTIGSGAVGSQTLTIGTAGGAITMNSGVVTNQLLNSNLALAVTTTANNASTYYKLTNHSTTNTLTIAGGISASTTGVKTLNVTGSGNTTISGAITSGTGNVSLFKTGSGTLTLSGGATFSGAGITDGANFTTSAVFREGTSILNGGTYGNSNGELVIGGVATHGGAGTNSTLRLDNGTTLNNISWLSIGRGNGNGTATSNLTLNGNASVTSTHLSAGYNAGNAGNTPKGAITLNGTSSLTVAGPNGEFHLGESGGSNFTMTLNDSSSVMLTGDSGNPTRRYIGGNNGGTGGATGVLTLNGAATFTDQGAGNAFNVGYQNGSGTLNINTGTSFTTGAEIRVAASNVNGTFSGTGTINVNGGTLNMAALTLARNNQDVASTLNATVNVTAGTVNVKSGQTLVGWRGTSSSGTINISGGTFNQGTTTTANMTLGSFAGATAAVNVSGTGALTFQNNSSLRFSDSINANAARTLTISSGNVSFYSDAGNTLGGTGVIDLMLTSNPTGTSTIQLNGGTLTANQIKATSASGTRVINFNGGTLKAAGNGFASTFLASGVATAANVRNGGAILHTNSNDVTIGQALLHSNIGGDNATDGGLTKQGSGTLTLTNTNTYTGKTTVTGGSLALGSAGSIATSSEIALNGGNFNVSAVSGFSTGASQILSGNGGSVTGDIIVNGTLAIGSSPGTMTFNDDLTISGSAVSNFEITDISFGVSTYDLAQSGIGSQTVTFGGSLNLLFSGGTYANNSTVQIFSFENYVGNFASVNFSGLGAGQSAVFDSSTGFVTVVPETEAALLGGIGMLVLLRRRRG